MPTLAPRDSKRICVIGGGIAGLVAAYELVKLGHDVILLEAANRCGGRIYTYRFDSDNYGEFGAMRIPLDHLCTWKYVQEFRLPHDIFVQENVDALYFLRGRRFTLEPWEPITDAYPGLYPTVRQQIGGPRPDEVLDRWIQQLTDKLPINEERWDAFSSDPQSLRLRFFDRFSVWQHIQAVLPPLRRTSPFSLLERALLGDFLNDEEWEYIGRATSMLWDEKVSYLEALVDTVPHHYPFMRRIVGGTGRLVEALQQSIRDMIHMESPVTEVALESNGVRVNWSSGGNQRSELFQYVICAVPAGATLRIRFTPPLPAKKYEALTNTSYQAAAKSLALCSTRRWESKDGIFGGGSHTDLEIQQCWYPSDNAQLASVRRFPESMRTIDYPDGTRVERPIPREWVARDPKVSDGPGVLLAAYMWGTNARRFASMSGGQRDSLVVECLEHLHPGIRKDIDRLEHWSWDAQTSPGGGAWAAFMPGERSRYQQLLAAPYPSGSAPGSRVFFAGEHLGISHAWIQSAVQTAQGAVWHVHYGA